MKILYIRFADSGPNVIDGGSILDRRLLQAFRRIDVNVEIEEVIRKRVLGVPFWRSQVSARTIDRIQMANRDGRKIIVSHESLFHIAHIAPIHALLVHNYFSHFTYRSRPLLEQYYRFGASRYYRRAFSAVKCVFFISHREHRIALADFPELYGRTDVCVPPPYTTHLLERSNSVMHLSGSKEWYPKRLSMLSLDDINIIERSGYTIEDLSDSTNPSVALINDRFEVGFKLKLVQMLSCRDVIASFSDLAEEIANLCPGNPFYRQVVTVEEAMNYFQEIFERYTELEIDTYYARLEENRYLPTWDQFAVQFVSLIQRTAHTI